MEKQTFELIQQESWITKTNAIFSLLWKIILLIFIFSLFVAEPEQKSDTPQNQNFTLNYLDESGFATEINKDTTATQVALIDIKGVIAEEDLGVMLEPLKQKRSDTIRKLNYIEAHPEIKGVILRINSPGGTVYDSDLIAEKVAQLKNSGCLVIALLEEQATSGGYYIASQANQIIAHELTITGSIGSIMEVPNAQVLLDKIGLKFNVIQSGEMKSMGGFYQEISSDEKDVFQAMIMESYNRFLDFVETGRQIERDKLKIIADGRIYTGTQSKELGLIDILGRYPEAVQTMKQLLETDKAQVFELNIKRSPYDFFFESLMGDIGVFNFLQKPNSTFQQGFNLQNRLFFL